MPGFASNSSANDPTAFALAADTNWDEVVPALDKTGAVPDRVKAGYKSRRWVGGKVRNTDSATHVVELRTNDGSATNVFESVSIPAGEIAVFTDEDDGLNLARSQALELRSTDAPTADKVIGIMYYRDEK